MIGSLFVTFFCNARWWSVLIQQLKVKTFQKVSSLKCFVYPIFDFLVLVTFGDAVMKIRKILYNLCLHFARQDGRENHATTGTKMPKTKRRKYGINETKMWLLPKMNAKLTVTVYSRVNAVDNFEFIFGRSDTMKDILRNILTFIPLRVWSYFVQKLNG